VAVEVEPVVSFAALSRACRTHAVPSACAGATAAAGAATAHADARTSIKRRMTSLPFEVVASLDTFPAGLFLIRDPIVSGKELV
jgi:hypothetical protein